MMRRDVTSWSPVVVLVGVMCLSVAGQELPWDEVYDPGTLRGLNFKLAEADWAAIQQDETYEIEVPGVFWEDGDPRLFNMLVRRKSATSLGGKVSFKVDFKSTRWNDIKKLSLENGDDQDVVSEGLAWYLHRLAANESYQPGLAAWVTLTIHLVRQVQVLDEAGNPVVDADGNALLEEQVEAAPQGVYVNLEQPDKHFLRHRGLWEKDKTWFYKQDDIGLPELKDWPFDSNMEEYDSPASLALNYSPFQALSGRGKKIDNPPPPDSVLEQELNSWINMDTLLRLGAVNAYTDNPDELFNKAKNYYWVDYESIGDDRRIYFPWDLDAAIRSTSSSIYGTISGGKRGKTTVAQHPYQEVILNHPAFRAQYNAILAELLDGALAVTDIQAFLDSAETLLSAALLADPNNQIGNTPEAIAEHFDSLRAWIAARHANVRVQLEQNGPPAPRK